MKIEDFRDGTLSSISLCHRDQRVVATCIDGSLSLWFEDGGDPQGSLTFAPDEVGRFIELLLHFFPVQRDRLRFSSSSSDVSMGDTEKLTLSTTNWGEPFSEGIRFDITQEDSSASYDSLYFDMEESDVRYLIRWVADKHRIATPFN